MHFTVQFFNSLIILSLLPIVLAVVDEWADPVATDDSDMKLLRPLLKNTNLEFRGLKLTYSANYDGWSNIAFHKKVDKLGGGLVVCTTTDGLVCG